MTGQWSTAVVVLWLPGAGQEMFLARAQLGIPLPKITAKMVFGGRSAYLLEDLLFIVGLCSGLAALRGAHCSVQPWALLQVPQHARATPVPWELPGQGMAAKARPTPSQEQAARGTGAAPALGISLWLTHGQAGMWVQLNKACGWAGLWGAGHAGTRLGQGLMAPGADTSSHVGGPVARALK